MPAKPLADPIFKAIEHNPTLPKANLIHLWYEDADAAWGLVDRDVDPETTLPELREMASTARILMGMSSTGYTISPMANTQDLAEAPTAQAATAQAFRPPGRTNRSGRNQTADQDIFEGLPIRQWRQAEALVGSAPEAEPIKGKDAWPEPPMPRDSHLLPEVSQQLLRAARAGRLYKPAEPSNDDDKENADEDKETKETQKGFNARKWAQIPRHLEEPEREYLAKRRKGLPSAYITTSVLGPLAPTAEMRKTKIKKTGPDGSVHIYEVLVEQGKTLENEVTEAEPAAAQAPETAVPGTVVEGVGVVNAEGVVVASEIIQPTPPRRRPPPPRRKPKKGPGRGRKRVIFEPGTEGARGTLAGNEGTSAAGLQATAIKLEGASDVPSTGSDTPMVDAGNEEGSGEESEESDEGDDDREEGELSDDAPPSPPRQPAQDPAPSLAEQPPPSTAASSPLSPAQFISQPPELIPPAIFVNREPSSSPDLPLAAVSHSRQGSLTRPPGTSASPPKEGDGDATFSDGEVDLFGSLERHLEKESQNAKSA